MTNNISSKMIAENLLTIGLSEEVRVIGFYAKFSQN